MVAEAECSVGGRLKHVDVKYRFATEAVRNREVRVRYIPTNLNFADIMTKALVPKKHKESVELIVSARTSCLIPSIVNPQIPIELALCCSFPLGVDVR